jgi:hypothetical protein
MTQEQDATARNKEDISPLDVAQPVMSSEKKANFGQPTIPEIARATVRGFLEGGVLLDLDKLHDPNARTLSDIALDDKIPEERNLVDSFRADHERQVAECKQTVRSVTDDVSGHRTMRENAAAWSPADVLTDEEALNELSAAQGAA